MQGSEFGPAAFDINAFDLHPRYQQSIAVKYADDSDLIIGAAMRDAVSAELADVAAWPEQNSLRLNPHKTRDLLITQEKE